MKTKLRFLLFSLLSTLFLYAQDDPNWTYIKKDNTGIGGLLHFMIQGDPFDNIWTGGYTSTTEEGSLVRISMQDTVYTNWSTYDEDYITNGLIYDVDFDSTGIIWVATASGVTTSEDGFEWTHYDTSNSALLADNTKGVAIDSEDQVWMVANSDTPALSGVGHFDGTLWLFSTFVEMGLTSPVELNDIAIDGQDNKWIATDGGLLQYDGIVWNQFNTTNSAISSDEILEVSVDDQDRIWILSSGAVDILDGTDWTHITAADLPVSSLNANSLDVRGDQVLITDASNFRLIYFDGTEWFAEFVNYHMFDSFIDNEGNYWASCSEAVIRYDGAEWTRFTQYNTGLPSDFNEDIFIDSQGRRWFANGNGGIQVFDCPAWEVYGPDNEGLFPNPQPIHQTTIGTSITEDGDGDIWFTYDGTSGYAIQIPGGNYNDYNSWIIWDNTNSVPELQFVEEVEATDDGLVFLRQFSANTPMYDKNTDTWTVWNMSNGLTSPPDCLTARPGGGMYVGRFQGIDVYENGSWTTIDLSPQGIGGIRDILFDGLDNMWIAAENGLWKFDGTTWTNWNIDNSNIAANYVTGIATDADNNIYISAHNTQIFPYYGGFSYFDGDSGNMTFTTFLAEDSPLGHKQVEDIEVDEFGNIWALAQSEGFSIYNPNGISGFKCIDRSLQRETFGISEETFENNQSLWSYPNPFENSTSVVFNTESTNTATIEVVNILGQQVFQKEITNIQRGTNEITLDLSDHTAGIYFCTLSNNHGKASIKLIKR